MKTETALNQSIGNYGQKAITRYQFSLMLFSLYKAKSYKGEPLYLQKPFPDYSDLHRYLSGVVNSGVLTPIRGFPTNTVYTVLGGSTVSAGEIVCIADPFCYVSHLSAMEYHGLTDRMPSKLFISSPTANQWKTLAEKRMIKDLKDDYDAYFENGLPSLRRIDLGKLGKVEKAELHQSSTKFLGAYKIVADSPIRVSSIGRTFFDMLSSPNLCGGINHVIDVFQEHGELYLQLIVDEFNQHGSKIDKVRAGYIFDELMNIEHPVIDEWVKFAQRGGSRKLDAANEYLPTFSEKWCLSINI